MLSVYLLMDLIRLSYSLYYGERLFYVRIIASLIYWSLSICSLKKVKFTTEIMAVFFLLTGVGNIILSTFTIHKQPGLMSIFALLGIYFTLGSVRLFKYGKQIRRPACPKKLK